ncbi:hypothetical protein KCP69_03805 [Salmonella enterica subsp. enterica]|nr:hypothetical protein KCP69_03805 [Salmonella enterica subsp. enterica]
MTQRKPANVPHRRFRMSPSGSGAYRPVRGPILVSLWRNGWSQGELRWKGMVIGASEGTEVQSHRRRQASPGDWLQGCTGAWWSAAVKVI